MVALKPCLVALAAASLAGCVAAGPMPGTPEFSAVQVSRAYDCGLRVDRGRIIARLPAEQRGRRGPERQPRGPLDLRHRLGRRVAVRRPEPVGTKIEVGLGEQLHLGGFDGLGMSPVRIWRRLARPGTGSGIADSSARV